MFSKETGARYTLQIEANKLTVPGSDIGDDDSRCYFAIFGQTAGNQNKRYMGNIILSDYYFVFDMQKSEIGIAKKNPAGLTYEEHPPGYFNDDNVHEGKRASEETRVEFKRTGDGSGGGSPAGWIIIFLLLLGGGGAGYLFWRRRKLSE